MYCEQNKIAPVYKRQNVKLDRKRLADLQEVEKFLGLTFSCKEYLHQALTHSSYANEHKMISNERLEFLGDAVLELAVSRCLFDRYASSNEGSLSKIRANLVNQKILSQLAEQLHLGEYLLVSTGLEQIQTKKYQAILEDAFEAVVGAVYLEHDFPKTAAWLWSIIQPVWDKMEKDGLDEDYKSRLQVYAQRRYKELPVYELVKVEGPEHDQIMQVRVFVQKFCAGEGTGRNKKEAEQQAAKRALLQLKVE